MVLQGNFSKNPTLIDDSTKNKLMKMKRTPMLNDYEQQLKHPICENIGEIEKY